MALKIVIVVVHLCIEVLAGEHIQHIIALLGGANDRSCTIDIKVEMRGIVHADGERLLPVVGLGGGGVVFHIVGHGGIDEELETAARKLHFCFG